MHDATIPGEVKILRLGHRPSRDKRVSTHLMLAARAFGADAAWYTGIKDVSLENSIKKIVNEWGGSFNINYSDSWRKVVNGWQGKKIHLTMYGLPITECINQIRADLSPKLIIVGSEKVPSELYHVADWNIAITSQPHSEVSALAVFLLMFNGNTVLRSRFENARLKIVPQVKGKKVESIKRI
jgi:tRNA (cytidine56-2'-O)-methyltransferase